jgi:hypothetical protein
MAWISALFPRFHGVDGSSVVNSTSRTTVIPTTDIMKIISSSVLTVPSSSVVIFGTHRSLSQNHHYGAINYRTISSSSLISGCLIIIVPNTPILTQRTSLGSSYLSYYLSNQEHRKVLVKGMLPSLDGRSLIISNTIFLFV